tara:strand:- start:586 stop:1506 length:921 start_codon:yes stop_codon:yes gene_type:complete
MRKTCFETIHKIGKKDKKIIFIGSDLTPGIMGEFKKDLKERFIMEGVSEQHIIGMASGMAKEGLKVYVNTIATFLTRRCFEQVVIDICLHNLPVRLIANGGGMVYAPLGPTHLAVDDISILRSIPNLTIVSPCDANEMENLVNSTKNFKYPMYVRLAKGGDEIVTNKKQSFILGKAKVFLNPQEKVFISTGAMTQIAIKASKVLSKKYKIKCGVIHMPTIKPLDKKILMKYVPKVKKIVTVEENYLAGGFGSSILEFVSDNFSEYTNKIKRVGIKNKFIKNYSDQETLLNIYGLNVNNLVKTMLDK